MFCTHFRVSVTLNSATKVPYEIKLLGRPLGKRWEVQVPYEVGFSLVGLLKHVPGTARGKTFSLGRSFEIQVLYEMELSLARSLGKRVCLGGSWLAGWVAASVWVAAGWLAGSAG